MRFVKMSFLLSLGFFSSVELICHLFKRNQVYRNHWTDSSLAGLTVYKLFRWRMKELSYAQAGPSTSPMSRVRVSELFENLPLSILQKKCFKYCWILVTFNLLMEGLISY
mmetsp:Transcript_17612/g.29739  ORF Transcript_17612/g.29739 Transcript_17612/m.29739 type:complete len:110 (+) Transcript_17612:178-507(+)|eukprot:CAMPEP_0168607976 /NCGR_PEP_ID=MMETSP0449_2-20121227/369_1 /TAXON_ID=1082188 /ORGANISM="Strombidium rassoulzadegani, Strain ras09" /LENGTH=109 /DNA_ID=CAMNT_0008647907 /DNA_START=92 /DNA_END=421 /DNA_ORIENTATION=+